MMAIGQIRWIFIHTAAYSGECDAAEIDAWHRARGWSAIGYHFVVRRSGHVEPGRDLIYAGAHVEGCNSRSLGICCEGHGDYEPHTRPQRAALLELCRTLMDRYDLTADCVLGHREVNGLIDAGLVGDHYRTAKTCPGRRVDMDEIRAALEQAPEPGAPHPLPDLPEVAVEMADSMSRLRRLAGRITSAVSPPPPRSV